MSDAARSGHDGEDQLQGLFGTAVCLKLAADGKWETAHVQALSNAGPAGHREMQRWLRDAGTDLAAEVGFTTGAFVGARLRPDERTDVGNRMRILVDILRRHHVSRHSRLTVWHVLRIVERVIEPRFSGQSPTRAEVGVLDLWRSMGSADLGSPPWHDMAGEFDRRQSAQALLGADLPAPLMVEVAYGPRGDGWLAAPLSRRHPDAPERYVAELAGLDRIARILSGAGEPLGSALT
ncbi:MAG: hypothetical protein M3O70_04715 [Actinomycetota bacterium]|nr:hypothetical protein [Actinomycetota bacterium]